MRIRNEQTNKLRIKVLRYSSDKRNTDVSIENGEVYVHVVSIKSECEKDFIKLMNEANCNYDKDYIISHKRETFTSKVKSTLSGTKVAKTNHGYIVNCDKIDEPIVKKIAAEFDVSCLCLSK